jgi:adenylate kinase
VTARSATTARRRRRAGGVRSRARRPVALTGTPGVGKTAVARRLAPAWKAVEVADLALRADAARRIRGGVEVDLARLRRALRAPRALDGVDVLVGHLAHLLPVREAIVLRCHPRELVRRLGRARRGTATDRTENFVSEALDLVLAEAARAGVPLYEIDTTHRAVGDVARDVRRRLRRGGAPRRGIVDWLADGSVTAHLLDGVG